MISTRQSAIPTSCHILFYGRLRNALPLLPILDPSKLYQATLKARAFPAILDTFGWSNPRYASSQKKRVACNGYPIFEPAS